MGPYTRSIHALIWLALAFNFISGNHVLADDRAHLASDADLYLVPIGVIPKDALESFAKHFQQQLKFNVAITAPLPLPDRAIDLHRRQLVAEQVLDTLTRVFVATRHNPHALVVGITANDLYIAASNWRFAFSYGQGRYAVVSAARMADGISTQDFWSAQVMRRMQKMFGKRIAVQYFGMGNRIPTAPVLAPPILGLDDLDRLDAYALDRALIGASTSFSAQNTNATPSKATTNRASTDDNIWLHLLILLLIIMALGASVYWAIKTHLHRTQMAWRDLAMKRGWRYTEGKKSWHDISFSIEGRIVETPFVLRQYQVGTGENMIAKTHLIMEYPSSYTLNLHPISGLLMGLFSRGGSKTGDRLYDCHFQLQASARTPPISAALRNKHIALPVSVVVNNNEVQLILNYNMAPGDIDILLELAKDWLNALGETPPKADSSVRHTRMSIFRCWLARFAMPFFWIYTTLSLVLFLRGGGEETNLPWKISWDLLWPPALVIGAAWLAVRWYRKKLQLRFLVDIMVVALGFLYVWGLSGAWVLAWNANMGSQREVLVVGAITDKHTSSGKGGLRRTLTIWDIDELRDVRINVSEETYESLRVGDPAGFNLKKGTLGIYFHR